MKKLLLLFIATLTLASCTKKDENIEDTSWKDYKVVEISSEGLSVLLRYKYKKDDYYANYEILRNSTHKRTLSPHGEEIIFMFRRQVVITKKLYSGTLKIDGKLIVTAESKPMETNGKLNNDLMITYNFKTKEHKISYVLPATFKPYN